ncbi:hypothetical protein JHK87_055424 [Glycine soja]|nr:hypothetical protein JHK87_055424 [Glycine soja]
MPKKSLPFSARMTTCEKPTGRGNLRLTHQKEENLRTLVSSIMEATFPSNWKNLTIEKYDGTIDPNEHLDVLIAQVSLYTMDDEILCQVFVMSLKG